MSMHDYDSSSLDVAISYIKGRHPRCVNYERCGKYATYSFRSTSGVLSKSCDDCRIGEMDGMQCEPTNLYGDCEVRILTKQGLL